MMYTILACFMKRTSSSIDENQIKVAEAVYRDELIMKKPLPPPTAVTPPSSCKAVAVKKSVRFADSEPAVLFFGDENKGIRNGEEVVGEEKREGIRLKVKMTKEEAARLLSKCKHGGQLDFNDVARELVALPINRVSVVSTTCTN